MHTPVYRIGMRIGVCISMARKRPMHVPTKVFTHVCSREDLWHWLRLGRRRDCKLDSRHNLISCVGIEVRECGADPGGTDPLGRDHFKNRVVAFVCGRCRRAWGPQGVVIINEGCAGSVTAHHTSSHTIAHPSLPFSKAPSSTGRAFKTLMVRTTAKTVHCNMECVQLHDIHEVR